MTQKPMFICIMGIDGVGKTTHVNLILEHLRKKDIKCQYQWLRFHHFFSLPLLIFCRAAGYTRLAYLGNTQKCSYHEFYKSRIVSIIYPWILLFDTFLFTTIKVYVPMFFGTSIVCDRFVYDTLIDIAVATKDYEIHRKSVGKLFLRLIPKNGKFIMLFLEKPLIFLRRPELRDDIIFDERYLLYESYTRIFKIPNASNRGTIQEVNNSILNTLEFSNPKLTK